MDTKITLITTASERKQDEKREIIATTQERVIETMSPKVVDPNKVYPTQGWQEDETTGERNGKFRAVKNPHFKEQDG